MKYLPLLALLLLAGCSQKVRLVDTGSNRHWAAAGHPDFDQRFVPFDDRRAQEQLQSPHVPDTNAVPVMEVNAKQLQKSMRGRAYWVDPIVPSCSVMFTEGGIVDDLNSLADTTDHAVIPVFVTYEYDWIQIVHDSLHFAHPLVVLANKDYSRGTSKNIRAFGADLLNNKGYHRNCNTFLFGADGELKGCNNYDGEYVPLTPAGELREAASAKK